MAYDIMSIPPEPDGMFVGRFVVPVDDQWHEIRLSGKILHVDSRSFGEVEFWAITDRDETKRVPRVFRAFGTGHPLPNNSRVAYIGTTVQDRLVWHLFELHGNPAQR